MSSVNIHTLLLCKIFYDCVSQTGPSGVQQRVLEELMLTRWDSDSPPLLSHSSSNSPTIVIQDSSDSERELTPDVNNSIMPSVLSEEAVETATTVAQSGATETTPSPVTTELTSIVHVDKSETAQTSTLPASSNSTQGIQHGQSVSTVTTERHDQMDLASTPRSAVSIIPVSLATKECGQAISASVESTLKEALFDGDLRGFGSVESCPEVSSSSAAAALEKSATPTRLNDEVSSTSGNGDPSEPTTLPSNTTVTGQQNLEPLSQEASPQEQPGTAANTANVDDDDFEISLYADDGAASLGSEGTPTSVILNRGLGESDKNVEKQSTKVEELKRKGHRSGSDRDSHAHHRKDGKSRHHAGEGGTRRRTSEKDEERRHHRHSRRRSRSRSNPRSRSHRYECRTTRDSSRSRRYSREKRRTRSRSMFSQSSSDSDNEASIRVRSAVLSKDDRTQRKIDHDERERDAHRRERKRQKRRESQSPRRPLPSHRRGEHDYERQSPQYERSDRFRLYSDDSWTEQHQISSAHGRSSEYSVSSRHGRQRKPNQKGVQPSRDSPGRMSFSDEESQESRVCDETKELAQELSEVDRQIQDNKKELLKSMLRRERLELLQKSLHSEDHSMSGATSALQKSAAATTKTTSEMERELVMLNRAITDGKKQLLRVLKRVEEDQLDMD